MDGRGQGSSRGESPFGPRSVPVSLPFRHRFATVFTVQVTVLTVSERVLHGRYGNRTVETRSFEREERESYGNETGMKRVFFFLG